MGTRMCPFWILELRMMEVVAATGAVKHAKSPVQLSPPTNQHPVFYGPDAPPVAQLMSQLNYWLNVRIIFVLL